MLLLDVGDPRPIDESLAKSADVIVERVPRRPKRRQGRPASLGGDHSWMFPALTQLRSIVEERGVAAVVSERRGAKPYLVALGQRYPDLVVFDSQESADTWARTGDLSGAIVLPLSQRIPAGMSHLVDERRTKPLVVSVVDNHILVDSRVQKVARSLADLGYESVLLGVADPKTKRGDYGFLGRALYLRTQVPTTARRRQRQSPPRTVVSAAGYASAGEMEAARRQARRAFKKSSGVRKLVAKARVKQVDLRSRIHEANARSFMGGAPRLGHRWRARAISSPLFRGDPEVQFPAILDLSAAFLPILAELRPDIIHVHDPSLLGIAFKAQARLRKSGFECSIVYDSHEWTPGIVRSHAYRRAVLEQLERRYVARCDAVITVSDPIAERLRARFALGALPRVVTNSPSSVPTRCERDLKRDAGLGESDKVLVYVGAVLGRLHEEVLDALEMLPEAHLVLVAMPSPRIDEMRESAVARGIADRLHRVDYVSADQVSDYISSADVGLIPFRVHGNADLGVPTKFREYVQAGLPVVVNDSGISADELRVRGIGEAYETGSATSLANAIGRVLAQPERYRSHITGELLHEYSWEKQEEVLAQVYSALRDPGTPEAGVDVVIGGTNAAGQGTAWSRALADAGRSSLSIECQVVEKPFGFQADVKVPRAALSHLETRARLATSVLAAGRALVLESLAPIASPEPNSVEPWERGIREAQALAASGRRVGLLFHGSDIRGPELHRSTHAWSPFDDPQAAELLRVLEDKTTRAQQALQTWEGPVMVSTPDLLAHVPSGATWVPVVVDVERFGWVERAPSDVPQVLHLPSSSLLKGTRWIAPVLEKLEAEGLIALVRSEQVSHDQVPGLMGACDIFVDQIGMGILGVAALEAMATGAAVVTDPGPEALQAYGEAVPLVPVDPESLEQALRDLAADASRRAELGRAGREFVVRHHSGDRSARAISDALGL